MRLELKRLAIAPSVEPAKIDVSSRSSVVASSSKVSLFLCSDFGNTTLSYFSSSGKSPCHSQMLGKKPIWMNSCVCLCPSAPCANPHHKYVWGPFCWTPPVGSRRPPNLCVWSGAGGQLLRVCVDVAMHCKCAIHHGLYTLCLLLPCWESSKLCAAKEHTSTFRRQGSCWTESSCSVHLSPLLMYTLWFFASSLVLSLARVHIQLPPARFTLDVATPVELTVTPLRHRDFVRVVAPPTTHEVAPVHALRVSVAPSALGALRPGVRVLVTIVWGLIEVYEVLLGGSVVARVALHQFGALAVEAHVRRAVVAVLEAVARLAERRQLVPARLQWTRPRHAVTLARHLRVQVHALEKTRNRKETVKFSWLSNSSAREEFPPQRAPVMEHMQMSPPRLRFAVPCRFAQCAQISSRWSASPLLFASKFLKWQESYPCQGGKKCVILAPKQ